LRGVHSPRGLRYWLAPQFTALFFLLHLVVTVLHPQDVLRDPGVGWHLATGKLILEGGTIPRQDPFSFTAAGRPWVDYYWLFQVVAAWLARIGGLPLYAAACVLVYAAVPALLYRRMGRAGANPLAALAVMPLAYTVLLSHAMARPHALTYVFVLVLLDWIDDVRNARRGPLSACWPVCLVALWCNLHGGFVTGVALVAVAAVATTFQAVLHRDAASRRAATILVVTTIAMGAAVLVNPYGIELPRAIGHHLGMESTAYFDEFQSPSFVGGGASVRAFEVMIIALLGMTALGRARFSLPDVSLLLVTTHWALTAQRNMNLFVLVAAPLLARAISPMIDALAPSASRRWKAIGEEQARLGSSGVYVAAASLAFLVLAKSGRLPFPTSLDDQQLTAGAVRYVAAHPDRFARPFHTDALGGTLIYDFWPAVHVFVDDRNVVYGDAFMMQDYFTVFLGRPGWDAVLDRWAITSAIVPTSAPCAALFAASPTWVERYRDAQTLIVERAVPTVTGDVEG
jgi:hypothetical protein